MTVTMMKIKPRPVQLLWLAYLGDRELFSRTADGAYQIKLKLSDHRERNEYGRLRYVSLGYDVRFLTMRNDDPSMIDDPHQADEEDGTIRIIATGVQSVAEAKAIAQADADGGRDAA